MRYFDRLPRHGHGQSRLTRTTGAAKRDLAMLDKQTSDLSEVPLAPDEAGEGKRQAAVGVPGVDHPGSSPGVSLASSGIGTGLRSSSGKALLVGFRAF